MSRIQMSPEDFSDVSGLPLDEVYAAMSEGRLSFSWNPWEGYIIKRGAVVRPYDERKEVQQWEICSQPGSTPGA